MTADYGGSAWEDSDPSIFKMIILADRTLRGEYQITNGYGPEKAQKVLQVKNQTFKAFLTSRDVIQVEKTYMKCKSVSFTRIIGILT